MEVPKGKVIFIFNKTEKDFEDFERMYQEYFKNPDKEENEIIEPSDPGYSTFDENNNPNALPMDNNFSRTTSSGSIQNLKEFGELLNRLLNAAWGSQWGTLKPVISIGDNTDHLKYPMITYDTNLREISDSPKPRLFNTVKEVVNGVPTGDSINIYKQTFDLIVEFNFYANTSLEMVELMHNFEDLMVMHSGFLKNEGVSEIFFLKEVPAKYSLNYKDTTPSKCLYYFVKIEKTTNVSLNLLNTIQERYYLLNKDG